MRKIILKSDSFWKWIDIADGNGLGINKYIDLIAKPPWIRPEYLVEELLNTRKESGDSSIMNNLSKCVPRRYFLELQYCASVYTAVFGKIFPPFISHVEELTYIEWLLYTEPNYLPYRDHLVHMFKVAHCGDFLLSSPKLLEKTKNDQFLSPHFMEWCDDRMIPVNCWGDKEKESIVQIALFLAAIFHDFGYGYFFLTRYKERLFKLYQWLLPRADAADPHTTATQTLLKSLPAYFVKNNHKWWLDNCQRNTDNVVSGFFHDCLPLNHSIASAFFLLDLTENLQKSGAISQELYVAFQLAAEACMIHDMTGDHNWAHLSIDPEGAGHFLSHRNQQNVPLATLLILSDELSAWDRPRMTHKANGNDQIVTELDYDNSIKSLKIDISDVEKTISINAVTLKGKEAVKKDFINGINKMKCLQNASNSNTLEVLGYRVTLS